ncbi:DUF2510 domain-containing protein, partial [Agrococcus sp. HG114]|uniref:DUF2510 domain-containing protein n=1 Tax=Agrococcus sp. HG114 TaxID=2969757 RepID=UPI00215AE937
AQRRAYEAWQAQQPPQPVPAGSAAHEGAPQPLGLPDAGPGRVPADWYVDPFRRADARWFDGREWTSSVLRAGTRAHDQPG